MKRSIVYKRSLLVMSMALPHTLVDFFWPTVLRLPCLKGINVGVVAFLKVEFVPGQEIALLKAKSLALHGANSG